MNIRLFFVPPLHIRVGSGVKLKLITNESLFGAYHGVHI